MPSVLIIIVTYNGKIHIPGCLAQLKNLPANMKCLVIDNGSTDGTTDLIKTDYTDVELIENYKNLGFGAANNIGLRKAIEEEYDYVYLLNQDAWITYEEILKLIEIAEGNPEYGIISPLQVYADKSKIDNNFFSKVTKEMIDDYLLSENTPKKIYCVKGLTIQAAHWVIPVRTLKISGGFSPTFFHYGEDVNLCRRMEYYGFKLGVVPSILGVHNRENRKNTSSHYLYLSIISWRQILSDPNIPFKLSRRLLEKMFLTFLNYPRYFFPAVAEFLWHLPSICRNRKLSIIEKGAFLYDRSN